MLFLLYFVGFLRLFRGGSLLLRVKVFELAFVCFFGDLLRVRNVSFFNLWFKFLGWC